MIKANDVISIVIPTLNRPELLIRCIKSIENQTCSNSIECIVIDSSHNNKTKHAIENFKKTRQNLNIVYIKNDNSYRPIDNWIFGIEKVSGKYSKFICDDDWLEDEYLKTCLDKFEDYKVDTVISNINIHKNFIKTNHTVVNYYKFETGVADKNRIINSIIGVESMLPVTPTASLMKTEILKKSFYSSLEHINCTKNLFGFDFHMSYFAAFNGNGTFLLNESLSNSWAGTDSMTLNVKKANIAYCYLYSLIRLIEESGYECSTKQKNLIEIKLGNIKLKSIFNNDYKKLHLNTSFNSKLNLFYILNSVIKKIMIKTKYKIITNS